MWNATFTPEEEAAEMARDKWESVETPWVSWVEGREGRPHQERMATWILWAAMVEN
jgi:hypothetical protein